jgi:hypothetical protein
MQAYIERNRGFGLQLLHGLTEFKAFQDWTDQEIDTLSSICKYYEVKENNKIIEEGEKATFLFIALAGVVHEVTDHGRLDIPPGVIPGAIEFFLPDERPHSIVSSSDVQIAVMTYSAINSLKLSDIALHSRLLQSLTISVLLHSTGSPMGRETRFHTSALIGSQPELFMKVTSTVDDQITSLPPPHLAQEHNSVWKDIAPKIKNRAHSLTLARQKELIHEEDLVISALTRENSSLKKQVLNLTTQLHLDAEQASRKENIWQGNQEYLQTLSRNLKSDLDFYRKGFIYIAVFHYVKMSRLAKLTRLLHSQIVKAATSSMIEECTLRADRESVDNVSLRSRNKRHLLSWSPKKCVELRRKFVVKGLIKECMYELSVLEKSAHTISTQKKHWHTTCQLFFDQNMALTTENNKTNKERQHIQKLLNTSNNTELKNAEELQQLQAKLAATEADSSILKCLLQSVERNGALTFRKSKQERAQLFEGSVELYRRMTQLQFEVSQLEIRKNKLEAEVAELGTRKTQCEKSCQLRHSRRVRCTSHEIYASPAIEYSWPADYRPFSAYSARQAPVKQYSKTFAETRPAATKSDAKTTSSQESRSINPRSLLPAVASDSFHRREEMRQKLKEPDGLSVSSVASVHDTQPSAVLLQHSEIPSPDCKITQLNDLQPRPSHPIPGSSEPRAAHSKLPVALASGKQVNLVDKYVSPVPTPASRPKNKKKSQVRSILARPHSHQRTNPSTLLPQNARRMISPRADEKRLTVDFDASDLDLRSFVGVKDLFRPDYLPENFVDSGKLYINF